MCTDPPHAFVATTEHVYAALLFSAWSQMATNWSSFAGGLVQIEGCEMVIHLPVQNPAYCTFDLMIPFSRGVGTVGVICWTVSTDEQGLRAALPVGKCVSSELFPDQGSAP